MPKFNFRLNICSFPQKTVPKKDKVSRGVYRQATHRLRYLSWAEQLKTFCNHSVSTPLWVSSFPAPHLLVRETCSERFLYTHTPTHVQPMYIQRLENTQNALWGFYRTNTLVSPEDSACNRIINPSIFQTSCTMSVDCNTIQVYISLKLIIK